MALPNKAFIRHGQHAVYTQVVMSRQILRVRPYFCEEYE